MTTEELIDMLTENIYDATTYLTLFMDNVEEAVSNYRLIPAEEVEEERELLGKYETIIKAIKAIL